MLYHLPNAQIDRIEIDHCRGKAKVWGNALPLQDSYQTSFAFTTDGISPVLWDTLFGHGLPPRTGITICTDLNTPSLSDLRWAYLASKVRYELALELAALDKLVATYH